MGTEVEEDQKICSLSVPLTCYGCLNEVPAFQSMSAFLFFKVQNIFLPLQAVTFIPVFRGTPPNPFSIWSSNLASQASQMYHANSQTGCLPVLELDCTHSHLWVFSYLIFLAWKFLKGAVRVQILKWWNNPWPPKPSGTVFLTDPWAPTLHFYYFNKLLLFQAQLLWVFALIPINSLGKWTYHVLLCSACHWTLSVVLMCLCSVSQSSEKNTTEREREREHFSWMTQLIWWFWESCRSHIERVGCTLETQKGIMSHS